MPSMEWRLLDNDAVAAIVQSQEGMAVKLGQLARTLGVEVKAATLAPGVSGEIHQTEEGKYRIRVNRHDPKVRQRFTVAHEIAHFLLHKDVIGDGIVDDKLYRSNLSDRREQQANRLAADILMPKQRIVEALERAIRQGVEDKLKYVANALEVSEPAMAIRLDVLGLGGHGA